MLSHLLVTFWYILHVTLTENVKQGESVAHMTSELYLDWNDNLAAIFEAELTYSASPFILFL
jgi:outer membrane protease